MRFSARIFLLLLVFLHFHSAINAQTTSPPPRATRFGVYNWGVDYSAYPGGPTDRLNWAADKVAGLGSKTIRVAMPGDTYQITPPPDASLAQVAASPAYDKLFSDTRFQTYLLTAYSASDLRSQWSDGYTTIEAAQTRNEFAQLGEYLLSQPRFAGKTFILLNWEGDNAIEPFANKSSIWESYTAWIQARADGVKAARQSFPNSTVKLYSGLEFNRVWVSKGVPCGAPVRDRAQQNPLRNRCVINYVAPRVEVDYYSYSAWQTIHETIAQGLKIKPAINDDLQRALNFVRAQQPAIREQNFLLGEFGFQRSHWGENAVANYLNETFDALEAKDSFQVSYAIFWQIIDNAPSFWAEDGGFGLYRSRYNQFALTKAGEVFQKRLAGQNTTSLIARPLIRFSDTELIRNGNESEALLVDSKRTVRIDAAAPESAFSVRDNKVQVMQGIRQFTLPRDAGVSYFESESQIIVGLPSQLRPGFATLSVTDRDGIESNGRRIFLSCLACPSIIGAEDEIGIGEVAPGESLNLRGANFALRGNTVVFEQEDNLGQLRRIVVAPDEAWREATDRLSFRVPLSLLPSKPAIIVVRTPQGLESNEFSVSISPKCMDCAPALHLQLAFRNQITNGEQYHPGAPIRVRGARFSLGGNKVVLENESRRFTLATFTESDSQIVTILPRELETGYARAYVIDAKGRESRAQTIYISQTTNRRQVNER